MSKRKPVHPIVKMQRDLANNYMNRAPIVIARHVKPLLDELERGLALYYPSGPNRRKAVDLLAAWRVRL